MRIQFASDLHLEMIEHRLPRARLVEPADGADLLVLAGDIHNGIKGVQAFTDWPVPVVYVAGNHEFYDHQWEQTRRNLRAACADTCVRFLDNDQFDFKGVRILGCTLWTDFRVQGGQQAQAMATVQRALTDFRVIQTQSGPLHAHQTLTEHERSRAWLATELARPFAGRTVVVSHHGPHPRSIHPRFAGNPVNPGFVSDLTPLLSEADLWFHGHTHDSFDYEQGRCRVLANPAGYILNWSSPTIDSRLDFENASFDPTRCVEVPD
jgi:predicted phosphodiesterase